MKPFFIAVVTIFGLYTGSASADSVTVDLVAPITNPQTPGSGNFSPVWGLGSDIIGDGINPNPGGVETDNSESANVIAPAMSTTDISAWYLLEVVNDVYATSISSFANAVPLDIDIYQVTGVTDVAGPAINYELSSSLGSAPMGALAIGLMAGTNYLVQASGTLSPGTYSFDIQVSSVVPVPAAVWLFGTAIVGLFGLRRKSGSTVAAA